MTLTILLTSLAAVRLQSRVSLNERDASNTKFRSLSDILQDCIPMIFFCAWVAVHRNIPPYREKIWLAILGRLRMLFWVIITPELVLAWAARQWVAAREIAKIYNNHFPDSRIKWTTTHGHFLVMGGFIFDQDGQTRIFSFEILQRLIRKGLLRGVNTEIAEDEIKDRSKSDTLTKAIAICETTWFIVQCIARHIQHLALTEFELVTLALSGVSGIMYVFWWNKPTEVRVPLKVDLIDPSEIDETTPDARSENSGNASEIAELPRQTPRAAPVLPSSADVIACILESGVEKEDANTFFTISAREVKEASSKFLGTLSRIVIDNIWDTKHGVLACLLRLSHGIYLLPAYMLFLFFFLPIFLLLFIFASIRDIINTFNLSPSARSVPIFYAPRTDNELGIEFIIFAIIGIVYGGFHCMAWNFEFPTDFDRIFWRTASVSITVLPILAILIGLIRNVSKQDFLTDIEKDIMGIIDLITTITLVIIFFLHVSARLLLFGHSVWLLRDQPESVYLTVNWSRFLPHISFT